MYKIISTDLIVSIIILALRVKDVEQIRQEHPSKVK